MERSYLDSNATTVVDPLVKQAMDPTEIPIHYTVSVPKHILK